MIPDIAKYWPGGIPAHVRPHSQPILDDDQVLEEIRGWRLFIEENAAALPSGDQPPNNSRVRQRRALVDRWASMTQPERDSYQERAPPAEPFSRRLCVEPPAVLRDEDVRSRDSPEVVFMPRHWPLDPDTRALWTKMRILTNLGSRFDDVGAIFRPSADPDETAAVTPKSLFMHEYVEAARFECMAMTTSGTVIFHQYKRGVRWIVDQEALETGRFLLCSIENNGSVDVELRPYPMCVEEAYNSTMALGKPLKNFTSAFLQCRPLNMRQPLVDILEDASRGGSAEGRLLLFEGGIDEWSDDIENYAPGYLEMEEAVTEVVDEETELLEAMVTDYDHSRFMPCD